MKDFLWTSTILVVNIKIMNTFKEVDCHTYIKSNKRLRMKYVHFELNYLDRIDNT